MLRTNVVYSALDVDNLPIQTDEDLKSAQYAALNLIWSPYEKLDLGIEVLYGTRENLERRQRVGHAAADERQVRFLMSTGFWGARGA